MIHIVYDRPHLLVGLVGSTPSAAPAPLFEIEANGGSLMPWYE